MDVALLAALSGIAAVLMAIAAVFLIRKMLKDENIMLLVPAIILIISEAGSIFLFAIFTFKLLNL